MHFEQKTITGKTSLLFISHSPGRYVVVSINIRGTSIVKITVFEPVLCMYSTSGPT